MVYITIKKKRNFSKILNIEVKQLKKLRIMCESRVLKTNKKILKNQCLEQSMFQKVKNYVYKNK